MKIAETSFKYLFERYYQTFDDKHPPWMSGWNRNCHQMKKTMLEYVRSGKFLFDSPTYLKMDVLDNLLFFIHMCIILIVTIVIS